MNNRQLADVDITQEDIDLGQQSGSRIKGCPLWRAAKRVIPDLDYIGPQTLRFKGGGRAQLPHDAIMFVRNADIKANSMGFGASNPTCFNDLKPTTLSLPTGPDDATD